MDKKHTPGPATKHGMYTFRDKGPDVLAPVQRSYLQELKHQFSTHPGRLEYRAQLAASLAMIVEIGLQSMRDEVDEGGDLWKANVTGRLGTYINSLSRLLDRWPEDDLDRPKTISELLNAQEGHQSHTEAPGRTESEDVDD